MAGAFFDRARPVNVCPVCNRGLEPSFDDDR